MEHLKMLYENRDFLESKIKETEAFAETLRNKLNDLNLEIEQTEILNEDKVETLDGPFFISDNNPYHGIISKNITEIIGPYFEMKGYNVVHLLKVFFEGDKYYYPDIVVFCDESKLDNRGYHGSPDLIIEVMTPGTEHRNRDMITKFRRYLEAGIKEYWIVDIESNFVYVYTLKHKAFVPFSPQNNWVNSQLFDDLSIPYQDLFR